MNNSATRGRVIHRFYLKMAEHTRFEKLVADAKNTSQKFHRKMRQRNRKAAKR
jgi:hypothetical protein